MASRRNWKVLSSDTVEKELERISLLSAALPKYREEAVEIVHEAARMIQGPDLISSIGTAAGHCGSIILAVRNLYSLQQHRRNNPYRL